jgi:predicted Na+-dependent transporter
LLSRLFAPPVRDGVFALGLAPTEVAAVGLVALAAGDAARAVAAVTGSLIVSAIVGPLAASVGGGAGGGGLELLGDFGLAVLVPLAIAIALRANAPGLARTAPELGAGATLAVAALVYAALSGTGGSELSSTVVGALAFLGLTFAVAFAGRQALPVDDRVTVPLVVALRDFAVAAALATQAFGRAAAGVAGVYGVLMLVLGSAASSRFARRRGAQ